MRNFFARRAERRERAESEEGERAFEGMKVAFEDRDYATALLLADKTITTCRKLYARSPSWAARQLGDRLRYRAEIRQEIGEYADALPDAEEAAELLGSDPHPDMPLEVPSTRLLVCELRAALGDHDGAMRYADAINAFRESVPPVGQTEAAGLARYAIAMFAVHEAELGTTAAWESLNLYRPMLASLARRDTLARFAQMVYQLALHHEPPTAELAPRMLLALQDAAEQMIRTVPVHPAALASPLHRDRLLATLNILERQSMWLAPLAESELAECYERLSYDLTRLPAAQWQDIVARLRRPLEECLAHRRE